MTGVFVSFDGVDRGRAAAVAEQARHMFEGMPDLRFKYFTIGEDGRPSRNFYVWESDETARAFFNDQLLAQIEEAYGVTPTIEFVEIVEVVDNTPS